MPAQVSTPPLRRSRAVPQGPAPARNDLFDLAGRVILVTGASRGLGAAMARAFARAGAQLVIWSRRAIALEREARRLAAFGSAVFAEPVDVRDRGRVRGAVRRALARFGRVDVLVNNAGIWAGDEALRLTRREWDDVMETDLASALFVSQAVAPAMRRRRYGKIINVASVAGIVALPHSAAYGTAKAGLMHLTRVLAVEWGPVGIRVTGIAPGVFRTDMTRDLFQDRRWCRQRQAEIPLGRFGEPDDLGGLAVFLASGASDHITGQTIVIDGGASLTV